MEFLDDDDNFSGPMKAKFLEQEITRLQELCRQNFATIDELKKQNGKLLDVQTEIKETTSDLAYSLAECPWWKEDHMSMAIRILASYTQKVQYILGLPTFIDPVEQLEKKGRFNNNTIKRILNKKRSSKHFIKKGNFKCQKCKKSFSLERNFNNHKNLHKQSVRTLHCKCGETFPAFLLIRHQTQECKQRKFVNQFVTSVQKSHHNLQIRRYVKCGQCQGTFVSSQTYYRHLKLCRFSINKWSRHQQLATNVSENGGVETPTKKSDATANQNGFPFTGQQSTVQFSNPQSANESVDSSTNTNMKATSSDANVTEMLNCSLSNLIDRGFTITVHNKPNERSFSRKYDKNSPKLSDGNDSVISHSNRKDKINNLSPNSSKSDLSKFSECNGNDTDLLLDQSSHEKQEIYKCNLCEFRTDVRHFLVSHSTSQCRWRHFLADQIPFLKTLHKMSFEEKNSSKDSAAINSAANLQCNEGLVISVNKRCRQRASTL